MSGILIKTYLRLSFRQPLRTVLMVMGIALGVAGVIAIDVSKESIGKSFELSTSALTSRSSHQIIGSNFVIPQGLFTRLRTELGIHTSAPVISRYVKSDQMGGSTFTLMGIDPFSEIYFRSFETMKPKGSGFLDLSSEKPAVLISKFNAEKFNLRLHNTLLLQFGNKQIRTVVAGLIDTGTTEGSNLADGIIVTDISTAQELLGMGDNITRVDLVLKKNKVETVRQILPKGTFLVETDKHNLVIRDLASSFETSLTAFSMLALFMGIFLIYNTVSFSVARRRKLNGTLKALGATAGQIFSLVIAEVFLFSFIGAIAGVLLGVLLGKGAVSAVCSTVSDMYFVLTISQVYISPATLLKGFAAGMAASFIAAVFPAAKASRTIPVTLMQPSSEQTVLQKRMPGFAFLGVVLILGAVVMFKFISLSAGADFLGVFMIFIGGSLLAPGIVTVILAAGSGPLGRIRNSLLKMAVRNIQRSLSRTSVLIASLMVVISVFIGIEVMTKSFKASIESWVDGHIGGHIHISSADELNRGLDKGLLNRIAAFPEVKEISAYNIHRIFSAAAGEVHIFSYLKDLSQKEWIWTAGSPEHVVSSVENGWIMVSEIFAGKHSFDPDGDAGVVLSTLQGAVRFKVAGVFRDYFMGGGRAVVSRDTMKRYWGHEDITAMQIFLHSTDHINPVMEAIRDMPVSPAMMKIVSGPSIKRGILEVFDKTFLITTALQILTAIVAFTGVFNAIMTLLMERQREMGILRACGAQSGQVGRLMLVECAINGLIAGVLALPLGVFLAWVLIDVVNQRSFGWSYDMVLSAGVLIQALILSVGAAVTAGIFPAFSAGRIDISRALHME